MNDPILKHKAASEAHALQLYTSLQNILEWAKGNRGKRDINPYAVPEVKQGLCTLALIQGRTDYLDADTTGEE